MSLQKTRLFLIGVIAAALFVQNPFFIVSLMETAFHIAGLIVLFVILVYLFKRL